MNKCIYTCSSRCDTRVPCAGRVHWLHIILVLNVMRRAIVCSVAEESKSTALYKPHTRGKWVHSVLLLSLKTSSSSSLCFGRYTNINCDTIIFGTFGWLNTPRFKWSLKYAWVWHALIAAFLIRLFIETCRHLAKLLNNYIIKYKHKKKTRNMSLCITVILFVDPLSLYIL